MVFTAEPSTVSPVLLTAFNRPDHTRRLVQALGRAGVRQLFVAVDGPRSTADQPLVDEVHKIILEEIDWDCSVQTKFESRNQGVRHGMISSIDWFFEHVDEGIILEDDCLPGQDFFRFCDDLLARYRDIPQVYQIAGDNTAGVAIDQDWAYCFVRYPHIWGWATWKRAWVNLDRDFTLWKNLRRRRQLRAVFPQRAERKIWVPIYNRLCDKGVPDTWDWIWSATLAMHGGLSVQPVRNLVSNIGFGPLATHTLQADHPRADQPQEPLGDIIHPPAVNRHLGAERQILLKTHLPLRLPSFWKILRKGSRKAVKWLKSVGAARFSRWFPLIKQS